MKTLRSGLLFALTPAIGLLLTAPAARAQDRCQAFRGTIVARLVPISQTAFVWKGEITFTIGSGVPLHGTTETINTGVKKGVPGDPADPVYIGTEETTVVLDNQAGGFVLVTRFVTPQKMFNATGLGWVNETGTIAPVPGDQGKFKNVYGHYTLRGPFGPGVPHLPDGIMGWTGEYHGNICGVD
jgi:hypothetical protein